MIKLCFKMHFSESTVLNVIRKFIDLRSVNGEYICDQKDFTRLTIIFKIVIKRFHINLEQTNTTYFSIYHVDLELFFGNIDFIMIVAEA